MLKNMNTQYRQVLDSARWAFSTRLQNKSTGGGGSSSWRRVSVLGYFCICLNTLLIGCLAAVDPLLYGDLTREDELVEDASAVLFLLSGVLLFSTAAAERKLALRCVYVLGGVLMVFVAGEEISWGQRIFGFATPDFLASVNTQNEFNVHNIKNSLSKFNEAYISGALMLCVVTCAALLSRNKKSLFRIPLPSILLVLGMIIMVSHHPDTPIHNFRLIHKFLIHNFFPYISDRVMLLLALILAYALFSKQYKLIIATAGATAIVAAIWYVNINYTDRYGLANANDIIETREYLLSLCCLFYSLELLLSVQAARSKLGDMFDHISRSVRPSWLQRRAARAPEASTVAGFMPYIFPAASALVILASIGLTVLQYNINKSERNHLKSTYQSLLSRDPEARSNFNIYLEVEDNRLFYIKKRCILFDTENMFFLHVIPTHTDDLPSFRKQYGFDNLDFAISRRKGTIFDGAMFDNMCIAMVELPGYPIDMIRTGQFNADGQIWKAEFPFPQ